MKVVRQRRGEWGKKKGWLGGWVGVWQLNKDFRKTSWKHRLHRVISRSEREQRPWAQMEGLKGWYKVLCGSESDCLEEEVQLQRKAYLQQDDWLTDFSINSLRRYPAHFYTRSPTYLPPPTHCISYTHIDKGAAQLMLMMWCSSLAASALHSSHSLRQRTNVWVVCGWSEFPTSYHSPHCNIILFTGILFHTVHSSAKVHF